MATNTKAELQFENRRLKYRIRALEKAATHKGSPADRSRSLFQGLPVILWTADAELRFTSFEGSAATFKDFHAGGVVGLTFYEFFQTVDATAPPLQAAQRALAGESLQYAGEWREKYLHVYVTPSKDAAGQIIGLSGVALDLSNQREFESRLRDVENRYRGLLNSIDELVFWCGFDGNILFANTAAETLLGFPVAGLRNRNITDFLDAESARLLNSHTHLLSGGGLPASLELVFLAESGRKVSLELLSQLVLSHGQPFCIQATGRDMTERKALEQQLRSSQKMHAVGLLTDSVAHHLDNLVTRVLSNAALCTLQATSKQIDDIIAASEEASLLIRSLNRLSQSTRSDVAPVDVHEVIGEVLAVLQTTCDKRIRIVASLRADRSYVSADWAQMHQAILSLCLNACDAMPSGGELRVYTRNSGGNVVVSVKDTGWGISEANRRRIFEPFFSTKQSAPGLGLALVEGILRLHNGSVHHDPSGGEGTLFHMTLPVCDPANPKVRRTEVVGGWGRVLVVDDDLAACQVLGKALRTLGYDVEICRRFHAAEHYEQNHPHIDVVFLDAGADWDAGVHFLRTLSTSNPAIRAIVGNGALDKVEACPGFDAQAVEVLAKPYSYQDLAGSLNRLLRRKVAQKA